MGEQLEFVSATLDGKPYAATRTHEHGLTVANVPDAFELTLVGICNPAANTKLSGLYVIERQLLHAVRGRGLPPHHLLPRPSRRDGRATPCTLRADKADVPGAAVQRQPGRAGRPGRRPPLRQVGRPVPQAELPVRAGRRQPGRARAAHHARSGKEHLLQVYVRARRPRQDRARDELADELACAGTRRASACRSTSSAS